MPSVSKKQRNFMAAAAHDPEFAKRVGVSQKVAKEFNQADKGRKFKDGGMAKCKKYEEGGLTFADMSEEDRGAAARKAIEDLNARQAAKSEAAMETPAPKKTARRAAKKVNAGDVRENLRDMDMAGVDTGYDATEARRNQSRVGTRHTLGKGMKAGGTVKSSGSGRGNGCAVRGKTKGRMV